MKEIKRNLDYSYDDIKNLWIVEEFISATEVIFVKAFSNLDDAVKFVEDNLY